jgi:hypothetical protein
MASLTGANPSTIAVGDFNGDTHLDVAVAHAGSRARPPDGFGNKVTVHLGNGSGGFVPPARVFSTCGSNTGLASGDLNGDGKADLVVGAMDCGRIYSYLSNGDGTFTHFADYDTTASYGGKANGVTLADFNLDGRLDVAATNLSHGSVSMFLGLGTGVFSLHGVFQSGFGIGAATSGDFTNDGKLDVAVSTASGPMVFVGNGLGGLSAVAPAGGTPYTGQLVGADFDGDGNLDVAIVRGPLGSVAVQRGNGSGQFLPNIDFAMGSYLPYLTSGDFNADGKIDIAAADGSASNPGFVVRLNTAVPSDSTPPIITGTVSGTLGANGWYSSDVTVTWSVSDPESPISSTSGCDTIVLSADTSGLTLTCTATSAGGTASQSVTIKLDKTPPGISFARSPAPNANGWNNTNVTVSFTCTDATSGVVSAGSTTIVATEGSGQSVPGSCSDNAGNSATTHATGISIDKSAPSVASIDAVPNPQQVNIPTTLNAGLTDAGPSGLASWDHSVNGASQGEQPASGASTNVSASLTFTSAGVYEVCATTTDLAGNASAASCILVTAYDPSAGFVTGGGWFNSPAGAYAANLAVTGKAHFGFVSKYEPGANVPTGNTEFQFRNANLNFKSTMYEWLVVAGARAQFKGAGSVNGVPGYSFLLNAIDGDQPGGGGTDRIRIKIWGPGGIVYDNNMGADDNGDPSTPLGGGSIVIHK